MNGRFKVPSTAASEINAAMDDPRSIDSELDEFEALIRSIHAAGATIDDVRARLGPLLPASGNIAAPAPSQSGTPMGFPSPEPNRDTLETRANASPDRESNQPNSGSPPSKGQSPFTRSNIPELTENTTFYGFEGRNFLGCSTLVTHTAAFEPRANPLDGSGNRLQHCSTPSSHQLSSRGLWLRGSVYHFRVRVPVDLKAAMGRTHLSRTLATDSLREARLLARKAQAQCDIMFDELPWSAYAFNAFSGLPLRALTSAVLRVN